MEDLTQKLAALESLSSLDRSAFSDEPSRLKALKEARELMQRLESPWEKLTGVTWNAPNRHGLLLTGIDIGLFDTLEKVPSGVTLDQLVETLPVKVDKALLRRMLNLLVNTGDAKAIDDKYAPTTFSTSIATVLGVKSAIKTAVDMTTSALHLHIYLKKIGYKEPASALHGNHYDAFGMDMFTRLKQFPDRGKLFNEFMTATTTLHDVAPWWTVYPSEQFLTGYEPSNGPLIIDVGGGVGIVLERFRETLPEPHKTTAALILQDLPSVIAHAKSRPLPSNLQAMEHSFFDPQPITGARAYFMRAIMHDWPDVDCQVILRHLHKAMKPGYSKLLIEDRVVPSQDVDLHIAAADITMMVSLDAKERTEEEWKGLFESCGFRLVKIWKGYRSVLEAEVV